jgi:Tfp pilus assembly protein PilF
VHQIKGEPQVSNTSLVTKAVRLLSWGVIAALVSGCQLINFDTGFQQDDAMERRILQSAHQPPQIDLLEMSQDMIDYLDHNMDANLSGWGLVARLQELLFSEDYLNMQYDDRAHFTAAEAFTTQRANCLSLMNLYIAMARHRGLTVQYQTVQVRPTWSRRGELLVLSEHINAVGRVGVSGRYIVDFTPEIRLQQGTARLISDEQALALYFNNIAVEYLLADELDLALDNFRYALQADPGLSIAWNNMGGVWSRTGRPELAEYSYLKSASLDKNNASAINNLARFYALQGDMARSVRYSRAVESYNNRNPYYHYLLGNLAYSEGEYQEAARHFRRAIRRYDLEPDFYLALGMVQKQLGEEELSDNLIKAAIAMRELGDQTYRTGRDRVRRVDNRTVLRSTSSGFTVVVSDN